MPMFSDSDISEAKRRVQEMQNRARQFTSNATENERIESLPQNDNQIHFTPKETSDSDKSSLVILALILLLSNEEADNMLILALLYLLF